MNHGTQSILTEDAFGTAVARHLSEASEQVPYDISERLRVARLQALSKRSKVAEVSVTEVTLAGHQATLQLGGARDGWWGRVAGVVPLIALLVGLFVISQVQDDLRANELAEIDSELLTDELPPGAYTDPGFLQFLRSKQAE